MKVMDPRLVLCHYSVKKSVWFGLQATKKITTNIDANVFCSSVNILGTQRADTFLIPKSSDTIQCTVLQLMLVVSAMCLIVKRLSLFSISLII